MDIKIKNEKKQIRKNRVRAKVSGTAHMPRLVTHFSNQHISVQLINDEKSETLLYMTDKSIEKEGKTLEIAKELGKKFAEEAGKKKIKKIVFDKSFKKYHGKVSALADALREGGLEF